MANRNLLILGGAMIVLALLFGGLGGGGIGDGDAIVSCSVTVRNPIGSDVEIVSNTCAVESCGFLSSAPSLLSAGPQDIVDVRLSAGGSADTRVAKLCEVPIPFLCSKEKTISLRTGCVDSSVSSGLIEVIENGEVVDSQSINF